MRDEQFTTNGTQNDGDMTDNMTEDIERRLNDMLVPVEPYLENRIQEFGPNGEEQFIQNVSIGEKLLDRAGKIDYKFVIDKEVEGEKEPQQHPWTEVLRDLNSSFAEVCVLSDLMALLQQRQFLMLDPVQQPRPPYNTSQVVVAKKVGLKSAARILQLGVENMNKDNIGKFHSALANMSSRFKMRKQGTYILGDATYRSCGSEKYFNEEALFEVTRNDDPEGYPLKVSPDPSVEMLSYVTVSESSTEKIRFPVPSYWKHLPFPHVQVLGILYSLFSKELFHLMTLDCMTHPSVVCKSVDNLITVRQSEGDKFYLQRQIEPALTPRRILEPSTPLKVEELCLQHHLHKLHKIRYEDDNSSQEGVAYSTMMLGIVNNKPKLPQLLNFQISHHQHKVKRQQIIDQLDKLAKEIKEPRVMIRSGPCSTPHESSLNVTLSPVSRIITSTKVMLRVTVGTTGFKNSYQIDSSQRGSVYSGPDCDMAISAIKREIRSYTLLMLRMTCTHNMWGILSTDQHGDQIYAQSPNKRNNLTLSVRADLSVCALFQETEYLIDRLPGSNVVHKLTLFLSVICDPIKLTRT